MQFNSNLLSAVELHISNFFKEHIPPEYVYHDFQHTSYVVEAASSIATAYQLPEEDQEILQLAAWFHDTGYTEGQEGHEQRSSQYAKVYLEKVGYDAEALEKILGCIIATKVPQKPQNLLQEILCDADFSHLGSKSYWDRCARVRQELHSTKGVLMSEQEWVDFELNFITQHQYHTAVARQIYDKRKQKHIRQLWKQKLRLNPDSVESMQALEKGKKKKKKKGGSKRSDRDLKQLNLGRGVETMYRTTYRTHVNLSSIADNKANFMLTINSIIASIVMTSLLTQLEDSNSKLFFPTLLLLAVCLTSLVFAILATRPKVTEGKFSRDDIEKKKSNLLFFGNFYNMKLEDFHWGMMEMIKDSDFLYSSMTRDLYFLGIVLAKKYRLLNYCYSIFMYGLILSVLAFALVFAF